VEVAVLTFSGSRFYVVAAATTNARLSTNVNCNILLFAVK